MAIAQTRTFEQSFYIADFRSLAKPSLSSIERKRLLGLRRLHAGGAKTLELHPLAPIILPPAGRKNDRGECEVRPL